MIHELITIYLPAAIASFFVSSFLARFNGHKSLLYLGIYCIIIPILAALVAGGIGRWTVIVLNSLALLILGLVLWLSGRKRVLATDKVADKLVVD